MAAFAALPVDCLASVLSFLPPREIARCARVSRAWAAAASSDDCWGRLLPSICWPPSDKEAVAAHLQGVGRTRLVLCKALCKGLVLDDDTWHVKLDPATGRLTLSANVAKACHVVWGAEPRYWEMERCKIPGITFRETAHLITVCWFEVGGEIRVPFALRPGRYAVSWRVSRDPVDMERSNLERKIATSSQWSEEVKVPRGIGTPNSQGNAVSRLCSDCGKLRLSPEEEASYLEHKHDVARLEAWCGRQRYCGFHWSNGLLKSEIGGAESAGFGGDVQSREFRVSSKTIEALPVWTQLPAGHVTVLKDDRGLGGENKLHVRLYEIETGSWKHGVYLSSVVFEEV
eukprot:TRINITY_DN34468_c0_g1_i1.p1 TRINITY_DN34468_c0_g1~~TRINITY_DN34468_c0_g1_i1.p1  ORF type:complete len:344 (-),score=-7.51 TRINITY_DN34468_c0_g1_i1:85-1116(-)